jgi:hypothetical protein
VRCDIEPIKRQLTYSISPHNHGAVKQRHSATLSEPLVMTWQKLNANFQCYVVSSDNDVKASLIYIQKETLFVLKYKNEHKRFDITQSKFTTIICLRYDRWGERSYNSSPTCMLDWDWSVETGAISAFAHVVCNLSLLVGIRSKLKKRGALPEKKKPYFSSCILTNKQKQNQN